MSKRKRLSYSEKMVNALDSLPNPVIDKRRNILVYLTNNRARSNESRYEHIIESRHELLPTDIKRIPSHISDSDLKKDKVRKNTFNYYIKRNRYGKECIKVCIQMDEKTHNKGIVKTIYIAKNVK